MKCVRRSETIRVHNVSFERVVKKKTQWCWKESHAEVFEDVVKTLIIYSPQILTPCNLELLIEIYDLAYVIQ